MNKIELNLDKKKKYVVACSFGPDSMALLALCIQNNLNFVVAHVNYRKREAANFEQQSLQKYCDERNIKVYVLDLLGEKHKGNFQDWARERRYKFFKEVLDKESADAVLVAHQQDDVIETYLMQKKRRNIVKNPGISANSQIFGITILRPLLDYSKEELRLFNEENEIPYSIDESNLTNAYDRNKIRHETVEKMSKEERELILHQIRDEIETEVAYKTRWTKSEFLNLSYSQTVKLLDYYFNKTGTHRDISERFYKEIQKAFTTKRCCKFDLTNRVRLEIDYGHVYIVNLMRLRSYHYTFSRSIQNELFDIDFTKGAEDRKIAELSTVMSVHNIKANTKAVIKNYSTTINRLYIDWKMPHFLREVWPGIFDENDKLLYVPRYRKQYTDNHKSKFVFNSEYFTEFSI